MPIIPRSKGFTLIEVLMSLVIFALIIAVCYTALGPAGVGFQQLQQVRDQMEEGAWMERQLHHDLNGLSDTSLTNILPIRSIADARGDAFFDELFLLSREAGHRGITLIHYKIDEANGQLIRESRMAWARTQTQNQSMTLGTCSSFHVEIMDQQGQWKQSWQPSLPKNPNMWPKAIRITIQHDGKEQQWWFAVYQGIRP